MPAAIEIDRLVSYFEADLSPLKKGVADGIKLVDQLEKRVKNFKGKINFTTGSGSGSSKSLSSEIDADMRKAMADIQRMESARIKMERDVTRAVEAESRKQAAARTREYKRSMSQIIADTKKAGAGQGGFLGSGLGGLSGLIPGLTAAGIVSSVGLLAKEGRDAYASLDKLARFTATLDKEFQTPEGLRKFTNDLVQLSLVVPQTAENIAKASFSVKSAYQDIKEPQLIEFLRQLSIQATASNTTVDAHAERVVALAKMYGITADQLGHFGAVMSTTFGDALATDAKIGETLQALIVPAKNAGQSLDELAAAIAAVQSTSTDAEQNATRLKNIYVKFLDPKFADKLKDVFNVDIADTTGKFKGLNEIVNEVAKSVEGLTDVEKAHKLGTVFTDQREAAGFLALLDVLDRYNERLRDGADSDTFQKKTDIMLGSADAKWQKLMNRVEQYKMEVGAAISDTAFGNVKDAASEWTDVLPQFAVIKHLPDMIKQAQGEAGSGGLAVGENFGRSVMLGIDGQAEAMAQAENKALQDSAAAAQPAATSSGSGLGQNFGLGMADGIALAAGPVGLAVKKLIDYAFSEGQAVQQSQSPSKRAAEELGLPFVQGIEVGINSRAAAMQNLVGNVVGGMFGPKTKAKVQANLKDLFSDLQYELSRLDPTASQQKNALERQFAAILTDQAASYDEQANQIFNYYQQIYDIEEAAYQKRLANIAKREENIRQRKDLKPKEKADQLRALGDERTDVTAARGQSGYETDKARVNALEEAGMRRVEIAQRELARTFVQTETLMIGIRETAEAAAKRQNDQELQQIDEKIQGYHDERDNFAAGSEGYVFWNNKMIEAQQDRKDAEVKGEGDIVRARDQDRQSVKDLASDVIDYTNQTKNAELEAAQAKFDLLKSHGANEATLMAAEMDLLQRRENYEHEQREREIRRTADHLRELDINHAQELQIEQNMNTQLEQEAQRHQAAMGQIASEHQQGGIFANWKKLMAQLPTWKGQFRQFASDLPTMIGDMFANGLQNADGTWKGFLHSLYQEFLRTIQQMMAELFRTQMIKLLVNLGTSLFGGMFGGGGGSGGGEANPWGLGGSDLIFHAAGGIASAGEVSVVGERGPEIFIPSVSGRVLSHDDSMSAVSGGGGRGTTIINNVTQVFKGPRGLTSPKSTRQQAEAAVVGLTAGARRTTGR